MQKMAGLSFSFRSSAGFSRPRRVGPKKYHDSLPLPTQFPLPPFSVRLQFRRAPQRPLPILCPLQLRKAFALLVAQVEELKSYPLDS